MIQGSMITIGGGLIQSGSADLGTKTITTNGTYLASSDSLDGYDEVTVNVSGGSTLTTKTITANGTYNASDDNADGYSSVTVSVSGGGATILSGTDAPISSQGNDGNLYLQTITGGDIFGKPTSNNPSNGTISATSTYSSYHPYQAFGIDNGGWGANGTSGTLTFTLSSGTCIPATLSFVDYFDVSGGYLKANTFSFEGQKTDNTWEQIYNKTDVATEKDETKTVSITSSTQYKAFRFVVNGGSGYAGIKNVVLISISSDELIIGDYVKVNGAWQNLIGSYISDVTT